MNLGANGGIKEARPSEECQPSKGKTNLRAQGFPRREATASPFTSMTTARSHDHGQGGELVKVSITLIFKTSRKA